MKYKPLNIQYAIAVHAGLYVQLNRRLYSMKEELLCNIFLHNYSNLKGK